MERRSAHFLNSDLALARSSQHLAGNDIQLRSSLRKPPKGMLAVRLALLGAAGIGIPATFACTRGGSGDTNPPASNEPNVAREEPTQISETVVFKTPTKEAIPTDTPAPMPTETPFMSRSLLNAEFEPASINEVVDAVDNAYRNNPDTESLLFFGNTIPRSLIEAILDICQHGTPESAGSPQLIIADRIDACARASAAMYSFYEQTGNELYYEASLKAAGYAMNNLPSEKKSDLTTLMQAFGVK